MSYEVLAQKWRPQNFSDVVGQEHITTTLKNQILSERIGHAYLFWGPRGTGKTTVARILAKAVNCPNRIQETQFDSVKTAEPCNQCEFCNEISQDRSFDVIEMDAASNRGIDTIRDLRENVKLSPATCPYKIYIIDEAHMLSTEAFNALLKTLEEPPPHVIFIMATTEHAKIPKTISSRCQDFDFRYLEDEKIIERLQLIARKEGISADLNVLTLITRQSEGCLRDAENLLELVSATGKDLTIEAVEQTIGLGSSSLLQELREAITERDLVKGLKTLNNLTKQGTDLSQCLDQLIGYFRDLRLLAIDSSLSEQVQSPKSDIAILKQKVEQMSVTRLSRIIKILMHANQDIKQYGYPQLQLETALIQLNSLEEGIPLEEIISKLSALEQKFDSAGLSAVSDSRSAIPDQRFPISEMITNSRRSAEAPHHDARDSVLAAEQSGVVNAPADRRERRNLIPDSERSERPDSHLNVSHRRRDLADLPSFWDEIKSKLPTLFINALPEGAVPTVNGTNTIEIPCSRSNLFMITDEDQRLVADVLKQEIGKPVKIELVASDTASESVVSEGEPEQAERKTPYMRKIEAQDDPQLKTALDLFEATVVETQ